MLVPLDFISHRKEDWLARQRDLLRKLQSTEVACYLPTPNENSSASFLFSVIRTTSSQSIQRHYNPTHLSLIYHLYNSLLQSLGSNKPEFREPGTTPI